jgi:hypothetical protein
MIVKQSLRCNSIAETPVVHPAALHNNEYISATAAISLALYRARHSFEYNNVAAFAPRNKSNTSPDASARAAAASSSPIAPTAPSAFTAAFVPISFNASTGVSTVVFRRPLLDFFFAGALAFAFSSSHPPGAAAVSVTVSTARASVSIVSVVDALFLRRGGISRVVRRIESIDDPTTRRRRRRP